MNEKMCDSSMLKIISPHDFDVVTYSFPSCSSPSDANFSKIVLCHLSAIFSVLLHDDCYRKYLM